MTKYNWVVGVLCASLGSIISNLGLNLQKLTHVRRSARLTTLRRASVSMQMSPEDQRKVIDDEISIIKEAQAPVMSESGLLQRSPLDEESMTAQLLTNQQQPDLEVSTGDDDNNNASSSYVREPLWLFGMGLVVLGAILDFTALAFASQIIVAPLGALTLVSNLWFAPYFSGETLTYRDKVATAAIITGCFIAVAFAPHDDKTENMSFKELFSYYTTNIFFFYCLFIFAIIWFVRRSIKRIEDAMMNSDSEVDINTSLVRHLATVPWGVRFLLKLTRLGYACIAGVCGAQSVMFAKGVALALKEHGLLLFIHFGSFLLLGGMATTIYFQIKWLNIGLSYFDALFMVPVFQSFWITGSVVAGLLVYEESKGMTWTQLIFFGIGICICVQGVYSLSQRPDREDALLKRQFMSRTPSNADEVEAEMSNSASEEDVPSLTHT